MQDLFPPNDPVPLVGPLFLVLPIHGLLLENVITVAIAISAVIAAMEAGTS
jgi:hypothetical protein